MTEGMTFVASSRQRIATLCLMVIGGAATVYGLARMPERTWPNLLLNGFYVLSLGLMGIVFIATQRLSGARWSASLRRIPEALMSILPVAAIVMLALFFGRHWIYPWARPGAFSQTPALAGNVRYLEVPFVFARMAFALALWVASAWLFRRTSLAQDRDPSLVHHQRLNRLAAVFIVAFAITFTFGSFDWLISLDPDWFSTMFAIYVFAGCFVQGLAAITLIVIALRQHNLVRAFINKDQIQDLGTLLFAFSTFWGYIWFCQYLLIWYANLPDEVSHYVRLTSGRWLPLFLLNVTVNWAFPFIALLSRAAKRNETVLKVVTVVLLFGHWLDLYLLIMPAMNVTPRAGLLELFIAAGYAGLCCFILTRALSRAPLVPINDPFLIDSLRLEHS